MLEGGRGHRHRHLVAQLRGHPRRHLLPGRQPEGAVLRRGQATALRVSASERGIAAQPAGQADRRLRRGRGAGAGHGIRAKAAENGVTDLEFLPGDEARAMEPALRVAGGAALAEHRHHRQPRADAGASRATSRMPAARSCSTRRCSAARCRAAAPFLLHDRRRRADGARMRGAGQRRRPARAGPRALDRRHPGRDDPDGSISARAATIPWSAGRRSGS